MAYMQCGHISTAYDENNNPVCQLCNGVNNGFNQVVHHKWEGRIAKCAYCDNVTTSDAELPFFSYQPSNGYDSYYCGCRDWM